MSTFAKILVLGLAVYASALPTNTTTTSTVVAPAPTPNTKALCQDLYTAPSALQRYQRLLVDPASGGLLSDSALRSQIVFDYNNGPSLDPGDTAGKITAAVAGTFPILVEQDISTVTAFLGPCR